MRRVALVIDNFAWLGGVNYYRNLISAVQELDDPEIKVLVFVPATTGPADISNFDGATVVRLRLLNNAGPWSLIRRLARRALFGWDIVLSGLLRWHAIDVLSHYAGKVPKYPGLSRIGWIPDFQYVHLPQFFSSEDRVARERATAEVIAHNDVIVLSSRDAQNDLNAVAAGTEVHSQVLHFVPQIPWDSCTDALVRSVRAKYDLPEEFVYLPNQFWAHKNHKIAVEALARVNTSGGDITIVASGSTKDHRSPEHFGVLQKMIKDLGVGERFRIVGVVPYLDLIGLMLGARAVLNPSRFEGWSTTVEEAKALGRNVILSDIAVHREQAPGNGVYFDPNDAEALAAALTAVMTPAAVSSSSLVEAREAYASARRAYGACYRDIVLNIAARKP